MKVRYLVLLLVGVCAFTAAQADIVGAYCTTDGDGAITMNHWDWSWDDATSTATMWIDETQHWGPAHIYPSFIADSEEDPFGYIIKEVENDTDFVWTDYHIELTLNKTFSFVSFSMPAGWTYVFNGPTQQGSDWTGTVDYFYGGPGTEIPIGGSGTFDVTVSFSGTANFILTQIPTPEPAALSLFALGALLLRRR